MTHPGQFDLIVAGGGLGGVLAACKYLEAHPDRKVALCEKSSTLGGRIKNLNAESNEWNLGLSAVSQELFEFWNQIHKLDPEASDLHDYQVQRQTRVGCLSGKDLSEIAIKDYFSKKGARLIGGAAAAREWEQIEADLGHQVEAAQDSSVAQLWTRQRKSPGAIVLQQIVHSLGVADLWGASSEAIFKRSAYLCSEPKYGAWTHALNDLVEFWSRQHRLECKTNCLVADANYGDQQWELHTSQGLLTAPQLIVAQSPWDALMWLPKEHWPTAVLNVALKAKPISCVHLSERVLDDIDLPDLIIVPAEDVQVIYHRPLKEITYQATIDFEMTLQAPECVKAIKRLKRARRKLHAAIEGLKSEGEHLTLLPVAWSQSCQASDRRWIEKLQKSKFNKKHLGFCGDSYGPEYNGDSNLIHSVLDCTEALR